MNRKKIIIILNLILVLFMLFGFAYDVCAAIDRSISPWGSVNQFDGKTATQNIQKLIQVPFGMVLYSVRLVALIIAICMLLWAAIRYMAPNLTLWGSVKDQAEVKRDISRFVIGSILLFGSSGLLTLIQYIVEDVV